jgi:hypothetical protein
MSTAARVNGAKQPAGSFLSFARAEHVAQAAHQLAAATITATAALRRQRVPFGALLGKDDGFRPHVTVLVHPLRTKVVRGNHAKVGGAKRAATGWFGAIGFNIDHPSRAVWCTAAVDDAHAPVQLRLGL